MTRLSGTLALILMLQLSIAFGSDVRSSSRLINIFNERDPGFFLEFQDLLAEYKPLDFGLGAPNFSPPDILRNALAKAAMSDDPVLSQYTPSSRGHPRLLKALAAWYSMLLKRALNPNENVIVTVGATGALHSAVQAHTEPGEEWIIFSPYYSSYDSVIKAAHGVPRYIPLVSTRISGNITSSDFKFDRRKFASLFNNRTRGILLNSPHNPTGKLFDRDELAFIAGLAIKWDAIVIYDEAYQFLIYDNEQHLRLATFPGMFERTISLGSGGKTFTATGYRIGWAYGPPDLISNMVVVDENVIICAPTPIQEAFAVIVESEVSNYGKPHSYVERLKRECTPKRDYIYNVLREAGMTPVYPEGSYYIIANWTTMDHGLVLDANKKHKDYSFVEWLVKNLRVYGLPMSKLYGSDDNDSYIDDSYIRFTIVKNWEIIKNMSAAVSKWKLKKAFN